MCFNLSYDETPELDRIKFKQQITWIRLSMLLRFRWIELNLSPTSGGGNGKVLDSGRASLKGTTNTTVGEINGTCDAV